MPRNAVEAGRDGRNGVNGTLFGAACVGNLVDLKFVTGIAPVISVAAVKAHFGKSVGRFAADKINHAVKAELLDLFFEVIKAFFDFHVAA